MLNMLVRQVRSIHGEIALPGDKSITHRAAMLAAMAVGETRIENFSTSEDCSSTLACLEALGVEITHHGGTVVIRGRGKNGFTEPRVNLDCGNSGTSMRLLAGLLAGQRFPSMLTGDSSLETRPMQRIIEPLTKMGATIDSVDAHAPLDISPPERLTAIEYRLSVASAQVKSAILLAALNADGETRVFESVPTRDHTERMLRWFGAEVTTMSGETGTQILLAGRSTLIARDLTIPADISSAAFFMVAAACLPGSCITLANVGFNPTRRAVFDALRGLGADIEVFDEKEVCNEPVASIRVRGGIAPAATVPPVLSGAIVANLIDEIPVLAVFATQLASGLEVRGAAELRVKESDRIAAIVANLRQMKAVVTEFPDGFRVERSVLEGATVDSYGDHRIAMAFSVAGLLARGQTNILQAQCADISFPGFLKTLLSVVK